MREAVKDGGEHMSGVSGDGGDPSSPYEIPRIRERVGDDKQLAYVNMAAFVDGPESGSRFVDVRMAGSVHAVILADRGMDLGQVWLQGHPVAWISGTGPVNPAYGDDENWLRLFHGGLLTGVGLENVGLPSEIDGTKYGLHGRLSLTPARNVHWYVPEDDPNAVAVCGRVRESVVHGIDLELTRTYRFSTRQPTIIVQDRLVNRGYSPAPVMMLYHINVGYPVVDASSYVVAPDHEALPFNEASVDGVANHLQLGPPRPDATAEVFELVLSPHDSDEVTVGVINENFAPTEGLGVLVTYSKTDLPRLWEWRMLGQGRYLVGIEPSTCGLSGRRDAIESGELEYLAPGESRECAIRIEIACGERLRAWRIDHHERKVT